MQATARELNLTDEQKQKLQTIVREQLEKLHGLRQDNSLTREDKMQKFKAAREEIAKEVKDVLTPEQFEKWKAKQGQLFGGAPGAGAAGSPAARLQEAIQELNLTDAQKEQLKPLYQEQMEKLRDLRQDASLSIPEKLDKLKAMQQEIAPQLKQVLDADQFAKWQKDTQQWLEELKAAVPEAEAELARIFHTPMEVATLRRVRARGLQAHTSAPVGRVPSRGVWGCEICGLGPPPTHL